MCYQANAGIPTPNVMSDSHAGLPKINIFKGLLSKRLRNIEPALLIIHKIMQKTYGFTISKLVLYYVNIVEGSQIVTIHYIASINL